VVPGRAAPCRNLSQIDFVNFKLKRNVSVFLRTNLQIETFELKMASANTVGDEGEISKAKVRCVVR
jgi:hypothetical protein